jgi:hypothetical protein
MYHKKIETQNDALDYIRKGEVADLLNRLDRLVEMIGEKDSEESEGET